MDRINQSGPSRLPDGDAVPPARKRRIGIVVVSLLLLSAVLAGILYLAWSARIDRTRVETMLGEWKRSAGQVAQAQGYALDFTYSDVSIGGGWLRHAELVDPVLTLKPLRSEEPGFRVTTARLELARNLFHHRGASLGLTQPLIVSDARGRWRFSPGERVSVDIEPLGDQSGEGIAYAFALPSHLVVERLGRQSDTIIGSTALGFGAHSSVEGRLNATRSAWRQEVQAKAVTIRRNDREAVIGQVASQVETTNENGASSAHYLLHLGALNGDGSWQSLGPADADLDLIVDGAPTVGEDVAAREKNIHVERILLTLPVTKILTTANFKSQPGELMPFGHGAVEVDRPGQLMAALRKAGLLRGAEQELAVTMLTKAVPDWKGGDAPIRIELKHEVNAPSYIGALTFENFLAQLVGQLLDQSDGLSLLGNPPVAAPAVPQAAPTPADPAAPAGTEQGNGEETRPSKQKAPHG